MSHGDCPLVTDHISIPERTESEEVLELSAEDHQIIDGEINQHQGKSKKRIVKKNCHADKYKIESKQYVGIATLPSGSTIEIYPKIAEGNGPFIISYAHESGDVVSTDADTGVMAGSSIILPLAKSFSSKVDKLLRNHRIDKNRETRRSSSGGRLNIDAAIDMEAGDYSAANRMFERQVTEYDTPANRVLYEGALRYQEIIGQDTQEHSDAKESIEGLINNFTHKNVQRPNQPKQLLNEIQRHPPNRLYDELLELVGPALDVEGIDLSRGKTPSHSYFVDMDDVFESLVERAINSRFSPEYRIKSQDYRRDAFEGPSSIGIKPDLVLLEDGEEVGVVDAKWQDSISRKDFYKSLSYGAFYDAPSIMIYPKVEDKSRSGGFEVPAAPDVYKLEIPVGTDISGYGEFEHTIEQQMEERLVKVLIEN